MECRSCLYPLWNLRARQCPECGAAFLPSQYEFNINSVRFCCAHCNQAYYGTGVQGHLEPSAFDCVKCGAPITMDEMVLLPAEGVTEKQTRVETAPWLDRKRIGWIKAWFLSVWYGLVLPHRMIRSVPADSEQGSAWWFAILTSGIFSAVNIIPTMVFFVAIAFSFQGGGGGGPATAGMGPLLTALPIVLVGVWAGMLVLLGLWGLVTHGALLITGGAPRSLGRTFHALCYSVGAMALMAVPCLGLYPFGFVPMLWWMVSAMVMTIIAHEGLHPGRAILAVGVFPLLLLVLLFGGFVSLMFVGVNQARFTSARAATAVAATMQTLDADMDVFVIEQGSYPPFALELIDGDPARLGEFTIETSLTEPWEILIGDQSMDQLMLMPPGRLRAHMQRIGAAMPDDVIAHRVGDFVFTHHGITWPPQDAGLWSMVMIPPAGAFVLVSGDEAVIQVFTVDGANERLSADAFKAALIEQNSLREANGIAPLPDPATISLRQPVVRAEGVRETFPIVEEPGDWDEP